MASREVIEIMDEFSWDVENICQELIEERRMREALDNQAEENNEEIRRLQKQIDDLEGRAGR